MARRPKKEIIDQDETPLGGDVVVISGQRHAFSPELLQVKEDYDRMTTKQKKWFDAYLINRNGSLSAEQAGYKGSLQTLASVATANRTKMQYMFDIVDAEAREVVQMVTEITGIYQFWGETLADQSHAMRDRLKASELLARALGAFDGENGDINININTERFDKVSDEVLEKFIIANSEPIEVPKAKNRFASDDD